MDVGATIIRINRPLRMLLLGAAIVLVACGASREFDRLFEAFDTSLDRADRTQAIVQLLKLVSDELPAIARFYNVIVEAPMASLCGPVVGGRAWNVHEWEWSS